MTVLGKLTHLGDAMSFCWQLIGLVSGIELGQYISHWIYLENHLKKGVQQRVSEESDFMCIPAFIVEDHGPKTLTPTVS